MTRLIWNCPVCILKGQCISVTEDCFILENSADPDEMPSYVTLDMGLHFSIKYLYTGILRMKMGYYRDIFPFKSAHICPGL